MSNDVIGILLLFTKCRLKMRGASMAENSARNARQITSAAENIFAMSLMTKLKPKD